MEEGGYLLSEPNYVHYFPHLPLSLLLCVCGYSQADSMTKYLSPFFLAPLVPSSYHYTDWYLYTGINTTQTPLQIFTVHRAPYEMHLAPTPCASSEPRASDLPMYPRDWWQQNEPT